MTEVLKINDILGHLDLREDMVVAEFGSGAGALTVSLARKLPRGKIYAMDIQEEKLSALQGKLNMEKINNVQTILCDLEEEKGSTLWDGVLDAVLIPNVLFQTENRYAIIKEANRILKVGGQLLVVDWLKQSSLGPRTGLVSPDEVKEMAEKSGFSLKKEFAAGDNHYGLLFVK